MLTYNHNKPQETAIESINTNVQDSNLNEVHGIEPILTEQYLTIDDLSVRIRYSRQSIYNLIHKNILIRNKHYFKPTPKKLLFKWAAIQEWVEGKVPDVTDTVTDSMPTPAPPPHTEANHKNRIKI